MEPRLQECINDMRRHEVKCYSICYYLLQDEQLAVKAAQEVMTTLICELTLREGSVVGIDDYIKKESIKQSLRVGCKVI